MQEDASLKVVLTAVVVNTFITLAKFLGWALSASPSMLAEGIHSLGDTANQLLMLVGIKQGEKGPSRQHPMGKGTARYLWNLVSAMGIFFIGFGVTTYHGLSSLFAGHAEAGNEQATWWPLGILLFSLILESYSLWVAWLAVRERLGKSSITKFMFTGDDPTSVAVFLEDSIAVLGVLLAALGIWLSDVTGSHIPDALASVLIGLLLGLMAVILAMSNSRLLIGQAIPEAEEDEILDYVQAFPSVEKVISLKTQVVGPQRVRLSMEVEFLGTALIDRVQLERDAGKIRGGKAVLPVLVACSERTVRLVGTEINKLEQALHERFPSIVTIDLEVN